MRKYANFLATESLPLIKSRTILVYKKYFNNILLNPKD